MASEQQYQLDQLLREGHVVIIDDRDAAVHLFRAAQRETDHKLTGSREQLPDGTTLYHVEFEPPPCANECGERTWGQDGLCYRCACEGHRLGWYNMDTGERR